MQGTVQTVVIQRMPNPSPNGDYGLVLLLDKVGLQPIEKILFQKCGGGAGIEGVNRGPEL